MNSRTKKVKVLVSQLVLSSRRLRPKIANKFISFIAGGYKDITSIFMVLVPKRMVDKTLSLGQGAALYGQLRQLSIGRPFSELVLIVLRIEPL